MKIIINFNKKSEIYIYCCVHREIAELHRSNAAQDSKAAETALSLEMQVREELKAQLEQERKSNKQEKESLITQVNDRSLDIQRNHVINIGLRYTDIPFYWHRREIHRDTLSLT